ncbi:hypothetical protein [Halorubrum trapanicum]|uniref:hypothetical protein n=1 Tax=Halorubrum trapanicum TaxID=29284 RepID=UPI000BBB4EDB|nr:hypothetical protein [Halorubrum trapanicum]
MTEEERGGDAGPDRIRSIAVHREDVANALEASLRSERQVVLRATPPFSGRMRARLHALDAGSGDDAEDTGSAGDSDAPAPLHIDPRALVKDAPPYPEVDDTAAELPDADLETRRERHAENVEAWREAVRERVAETVEIEVDGETRTVDVTVLG